MYWLLVAISIWCLLAATNLLPMERKRDTAMSCMSLRALLFGSSESEVELAKRIERRSRNPYPMAPVFSMTAGIKSRLWLSQAALYFSILASATADDLARALPDLVVLDARQTSGGRC